MHASGLLGDWLLLARLALAAVFLLAAVGKALDPSAFRKALRSFGVPERFLPAGALGIPALEGAIALLLVPGSTGRWGGVAAAGLLLAFTVVVGRALAQGRRPTCQCFGPLSDPAVGRGTVARNAVLLGLALFVGIGGPGPGPLEWWAGLAGVERRMVGLLGPGVGALAALGAAVAGQRRRTAELERRLSRAERMLGPADGLPVGSPAPAFLLPTLAGGAASLEELVSGQGGVVLIFVAPRCSQCEELERGLASLQQRLPIAVLTRIGATQAHGIDPARVLIQAEWEVGERYGCTTTPSAVVVGPGPSIASQLIQGTPTIRSLLDEMEVGKPIPRWATSG